MINLFRGTESGTIKAKVMAIALIPSIALLIVGAGVSGYLVSRGLEAKQFAEDVRGSLGPMTEFIEATQEERRLSTLRVTGLTPVGGEAMTFQREQVDRALDSLETAAGELTDQAEQLSRELSALRSASMQLPSIRERVDAGQINAAQVYEYYSGLVEFVGEGIRGIARSGNEAVIAFEQMISYDLFRSVEAQSRSHVLVERAIADGLPQKVYHELAHQMGTYHEIVERVLSRLTPAEQRSYQKLKDAPFWGTLTKGDNAVMALGPGEHSPKISIEAWERAAKDLSGGLMKLYQSHSTYAADLGAASGNQTLRTSLISGALILLIAAAAVVIALRLSRRLIERLSRLREETLSLSDRELPNLVGRLREGDRIDIEDQVPWLDHGTDEIGQVATAFNKAQRTAISAAVNEAETRKGVGKVFLNIAHRSQVIVHRQLKVLDKVERSEDDPEQLRLLFQLDHLATRSRRNAENLIILGGQQPGRQWRNPVSLREVVRSAVAETEHYTRVVTSAVPDALMDGSVIADLVHLLAELVDNATAFSPPQAKVEVRGNLAGRGVVIEVEDQGLGIEPDQREELNEMLRKPPDFSVMALSTESRVGMFVVARLAQRHGIKIALRESIYGGTTAVVLIPNLLVVQESTPHEVPAMLSIGPGPADELTLEYPAIGAGPAEPPTLPPVEVPEPRPDTNGKPAGRPPVSGKPARTGSAKQRPSGNGRRSPSAGTAATSTPSPQRPPLPRRNRQESLAPQLKDDPGDHPATAGPLEGGAGGTPRDEAGDAQRTRTQLAAFQRGTAQARNVDVAAEPSPNGHPL